MVFVFDAHLLSVKRVIYSMRAPELTSAPDGSPMKTGRQMSTRFDTMWLANPNLG